MQTNESSWADMSERPFQSWIYTFLNFPPLSDCSHILTSFFASISLQNPVYIMVSKICYKNTLVKSMIKCHWEIYSHVLKNLLILFLNNVTWQTFSRCMFKGIFIWKN